MGNSAVGGAACSLTRAITVSTAGDFALLFACKWPAAVNGTFPTPAILRTATAGFWTAFQDDAANGDDIEVEYKTGASTNNDVSIGSNASLVGKWIHFAFVYTHSTGAQSIYVLTEGFNPASPSFLLSPSVGTTSATLPTIVDVFSDVRDDLPFVNGKIGHVIVAPFAPTQAQVIAQFQQRAPTAAFSGAGSYTYLACTDAANVEIDAGTTASNFTKTGSFTDSTEQPLEWAAQAPNTLFFGGM